MSRQKLRKVSIIVGGDYSKPISFDPKLSYTCACSQSVTDSSTVEEDDDSSIESSKWTNDEEDILRAAVETIGFDWERIAKAWFNDEQSAEACQARAMELNLPNHRVSNKTGFFHLRSKEQHHLRTKPTSASSSPSKSLSIRKRRELEALEERRLFGKRRSKFENELIHGAYLVGHTKLENILRKNGIETGEELSVSFSSVMVEMRALKKLDVKNSVENAGKIVPKLPKAISDLNDAQVLSPKRNLNNLGEKIHKMSDKRNNDRRLVNLKSSVLPFESALKDAIELLSPQKFNDGSRDEEGLNEFISPKLESSFPCIPIPPPIAQVPFPKKTVFLFRKSRPST